MLAKQALGMNFLARWKAFRESAESKGTGSPNRRWVAASVVAVVFLVGITGVILGYRSLRQLFSPPTLGLHATRKAGQFLVNWDRKAPTILRARRGVLAIRDGSHEDYLELDPLQLRRGNLAYTSSEADIQFRLDVFGDRDRSLSESIQVSTPQNSGRPDTSSKPSLADVRTEGPLVREEQAAARRKSEVGAATVVPAISSSPVVIRKNNPSVTASYNGPRVIQQVEPVIPAESRASLASDAQINVHVRIDPEGAVTNAEVTAASGARDPSLALAATRAAQQFRYQPARLNDRNVPSSMILSFRLCANVIPGCAHGRLSALERLDQVFKEAS